MIFVHNLWNKNIEHKHFKVIDVGDLHILKEDLNFNDIKYEKYIPNLTKNINKPLYDVPIEKFQNMFDNHKNLKTKKGLSSTGNSIHIRTDIESKIPLCDFYNKELKNKIYEIYKQDFDIFKKHGHNYDI